MLNKRTLVLGVVVSVLAVVMTAGLTFAAGEVVTFDLANQTRGEAGDSTRTTWFEDGFTVGVDSDAGADWPLFFFAHPNGEEGDRIIRVRDRDNGSTFKEWLVVARADGGTFNLGSIDVVSLDNCAAVWVSSDKTGSPMSVTATGTALFAGAGWENVTWVRIMPELGIPSGECKADLDNIAAAAGDGGSNGGSDGTKGDQKIESGVPGKGLDSGPGQQKEYNPKSRAGERVGHK